MSAGLRKDDTRTARITAEQTDGTDAFDCCTHFSVYAFVVRVSSGALEAAVKLLASMIVVVFAFPVFAAAEQSTVSTDLRRLGPQELLEQLRQNPRRWNEGIVAIESGNADWVRAVLAIYPVTHEGERSELHDALFASMRTQAAMVLLNVPNEMDVESLCGGRDDPLATFELALAEQNAVETAVASPGTQISATQKSKCLSALRAGKTNLHRFFGK